MLPSLEVLLAFSFLLFFFGTGSLEIITHALSLSFLPRVLPDWQETACWTLIVLLLYPNVFISGLSLLRPNFLWLPKYSSTESWQNLSVNTYCMPSFSRNLVASATECAVICNPSWVCQDINIRLRALLENSPGQLAMLSFQSLRYPRKSFSNQANLWSFTDVYGARNGFLFLCYSVVLRTLRQSKNESINFAVAVASGEPNNLITAATVALSTWAARFTRIVEYEFSLIWSKVILGNNVKPFSASCTDHHSTCT